MFIGPVPNGFQGLRVLPQVWVLTVVDKATRCLVRKVLLKFQLFKRGWVLSNVVVETVSVVFLVGDVSNPAKLFQVILAECIGQLFCRRGVEAKVVALFVLPLGTEVVHRFGN